MLTQVPIAAHNTSNFEGYLAYINSVEMLNEEQEKSLFLDYQRNDDLNAAQNIVLSHLRFVAHIAKSYKGYGLPMEDLVQEGTIGLMKSVKKFKLDFGVRLSSFAIHYIKAEIQEYVIRNWRLVKATTTKAKRKLFYNLRRLKLKNEWLSNQDKKGIAQKLNVREVDITDMEVQFSQPDIYINPSLSISSNNDEENITSEKIHLFEDKSEHFTSIFIEQDFNDKAFPLIKEIISNLDERSKDIIQNRWMCEQKKTHKYFSKKYGVSPERIRQLEEKALIKIKRKVNRLIL